MSGLKVGLVASGGEESKQLSQLLEQNGAQIVHNISPDKIADEHVEDDNLHVWLLYVDDDSWHDSVDHLLDESEVPVYFSEPGTLAKQSHPEYWCNNLLARLYELTGIENESAVPAQQVSNPATPTQQPVAEKADNEEKLPETPISDSSAGEESVSALSKSLDELEVTTADLPDGMAAELVSELESISPVLTDDLPSDSLQITDDDSDILTLDDEFDIDESASESLDDLVADFETNEEPLIEDDSSEEEAEIELADFDSSQFELDDKSLAEVESETIELEPMEPDPVESEPVEPEQVESESLELEPADSEQSQLESIDLEQTTLETATSQDEEPEFEIELATFENFDQVEPKPNETTATDPVLSERIEPVLNDADLIETEESLAEDSLADSFNNELQLDDDFHLELDGELDVDADSIDNLQLENSRIESPQTEELQIEEPQTENLQSESEVSLDLTEEEQSSVSADLSLESIESEAPVATGKATYVIDGEEEQQPEAQTASPQEQPEAEEIGLSLEAIDEDKPITGKATYVIDEGDEEELQPVEPAKVEVAETTEEPEEDFSLSLEPIAQEQQADWLQDIGEEELEANNDVEMQIAEIAAEELDVIAGESQLEQQEANDSIEQASEFSIDELEFSVEEDNESAEDELVVADKEEAEHLASTDQQLIDSEISSGIEIDEDAIREIAREALADEVEEIMPEPMVEEELTLDDNGQIEIQNEQSIAPIDANDEPLEFDIPMLDETAGDVEFEERLVPQYQEPEYTPCWVIGASLGGPAAVKRFLNSIPADINAGFVIAQHIDENFLPVLAEILTNSSQFNVTVAQGSNDIKPGSVFLAPLKGKLVFLQDGSMLVDHSQKWSAPYSPCIDDVIEGVSQVYGDKSGAIIFSGMGEDGLVGARKMRQQGGQVWAQSTDTCANASMPESVINNGEADYVGTPEQLAERLVGTLALASAN